MLFLYFITFIELTGTWLVNVNMIPFVNLLIIVSTDLDRERKEFVLHSV